MERRISSRRLVISAVIAAAVGVATAFLVPKPLPELTREELLAEVRAGNVHEVLVDDDVVTGVSSSRGRFRVVMPRGDKSLLSELRALGVEVKFEEWSPSLI